MTEARPAPLPIPDNFPFEWPDPALEALHWTWDQMHHPHPKTPLSATFEARAFGEGASRGFQALGMPVTTEVLIANGYWYYGAKFSQPTATSPPTWFPKVEEEFIRRLPGLNQTWEREYLPEVQAANGRLRDFDYAEASTDGLLAFIGEAYRLRVRLWDIHMQTVIPVMAIASRFAGVYEQVLGKPDGNEPYLMLQGFDNLTVESGKALWDLSRRARAEPAVTKIIAETPLGQLSKELRRSAEGREFWAEFERYLGRYGWRSDAFELADPAWVEDPAIPIATLRDLLAAPDDADPARREQRSREERKRLVSEAMERLDGNTGKQLFESMLVLAQQYLPIQENHNFYIDQMNTVLLRLPFLELGRRLRSAGAVAEVGDVFYLTADELPEAARRPADGGWARLVAERRAERKRWAAVVPPREIGTPAPVGTRQNPWSGAFWGPPPEPSNDPKVINGTGASAGVVTATARVVHTLAEAGKLQPGDVLVCEMTLPAWTPLFASVSAVVADSGGVLSHCAIVAREYRVPCVVGTQVGTQVLKDGQRITVDGGQGVVRIED